MHGYWVASAVPGCGVGALTDESRRQAMSTATTRTRTGLRRSRRTHPSAHGPFAVGRRARLPGRPSVSTGAAAAGLSALMVAGLAIRVAIPRGLWLDEAISVEQAQLGLPELIQDLAHTDRHPPLHHVLLWAIGRTVGDGDLAMRAPSIVAGVLLIAAVYWLGVEVYDRRTGLVAALLATLAPILVWYSQEARGYELEALFCTVAAVGCVRVIKRGSGWDWALHTVAAALAVWTHWFAIFVVLATELAFLWELRRRWRAPGQSAGRYAMRWALATAALLAQFVPLALLAAEQIRATGTAGGYAGATVDAEGMSFYTIVSNVAWAFFGFHPGVVTRILSAVWPLFMLAALLLLGRRVGRCSAVLLACALVPVAALLALAIHSPDVFDVRYFIVAVPPALVLLARLALSWPASAAARAVVVAAMAGTLAVALVDQQRNDHNPRRYDFREALARAEERAGPRGVVLYEPDELRYVIARYAPTLVARPIGRVAPSRKQARRVVVLGSFLEQERNRRATDRVVGALKATRREGPTDRFPGVRLWSFQ